ncbi:MAG TPA: hypothetical protein DCL54_13680, partial [Alphaproteobacteria bacterium]|nr:hypothetical protein [Alphaproteobacteria bacterium]
GDLIDTGSLDLRPPRLTTPAFEVRDWRGRKVLETAATENGQVTRNQIALDLEERALSLAYAPGDEPYFVLGTNFAIRKYAFRGSLLQTIAVPAGAQRLTVTPDGRLYVAVLGDGTIRWYDAARGRELFAVYVSPKDQRWIGWTPNGRYDGSPGSDELLGWQINRGPDREPLFYSAQVFGSLFYTTDLGARVLRSLEIPDAPEPATLLARLVPVVELFGEPEVAVGKLTVEFQIKAPSGRPITGLRATINGVAAEVDTSEGPVPADTRIRLTFDLPPGAETNRTFSLSASHDDNVYGDAAERGFQVVGRDAPQQDEFKQERLLGLVVGISDYRDPGIPDLRFGERDATEVTAAFQRQLSRFYKQVDLQTLVGAQATRANIINALESIRRKRPSTLDTVLLFFAGHGVPDPNNPAGGAQAGRYFFVTHDANYSGGELAATAFSYTDLYAFIRETEGRQLVFLDTCYSGLVSETGAAVQSFARLPKPDANGIAREAGRLGAYVVAATTGNAVAYEDERLQNGALTFALLEAMDGRANDLPLSENRRITTAGLRLHLESTIKRVTNNRQKPAILDLNTEAVEIAAVVPPNPSFGALIPAPAQ